MEAWLNDLLCLNAAEHIPKPPPQLPHPSDCELYFVERDTLFSYHKVPIKSTAVPIPSPTPQHTCCVAFLLQL